MRLFRASLNYVTHRTTFVAAALLPFGALPFIVSLASPSSVAAEPLWQPSPWDHGGAEVDSGGPYLFSPDDPLTGTTNVRYQNLFDRERELYGYDPRYLPNVVTFDDANRAWMVVGDLGQDGVSKPYSTAVAYDVNAPNNASLDSWLQRLDANGQWQTLSLTDTVRAVRPDYLAPGQPLAQVSDEHQDHERVFFDADGDTYVHVSKGGGTGLLLHYSQQNQAWAGYDAPSLGYSLEADQRRHDGSLPTFFRVESGGSTLKLVTPTKNPDGTLSIPSPMTVDLTANLPPGVTGSWQAELFQPHSGRGNVTLTHGDYIHVVFASMNPAIQDANGNGTAQVYMRINRLTGEVATPPQVLAITHSNADATPDEHNIPSMVIDSNGQLHVVTGAHNREIHHLYSTKSVDDPTWDPASDWSNPVSLGTVNTDGQGNAVSGYTYPAVQIDENDNLYVVARNFPGNGPVGQRMVLDVLRGNADGQGAWQWDDLQSLVVPDHIRYSIFYHKLTSDGDGRLFLTYYYLARTSNSIDQNRDGLLDAHLAKWPDETVPDHYNFGQKYPHDPVIMTSTDGGDTWSLATTADIFPALARAWSDTTPGGDNYGSDAHWFPDSAPGAANLVTVANGGTALIDTTNTGVNAALADQLTIGGPSSGTVEVSGLGQLSVGGDLLLGHVVAGADGAGTLKVFGPNTAVQIGGSLTIGSAGTLAAEISGPTHPPIVVTGDVHLSGGSLEVTFGTAPASGAHLYSILSATGSISGPPSNITVPHPLSATGTSSDPLGRVTPVITTASEVQVGLAVPGDADFSGQVTAGVDGSVLLANLGSTGASVPPQGAKQWNNGDFSGDGNATAGVDGSLLLGNMGAGPYDTAGAGTASARYNPATGEIWIEASGVALLQIVSAGGHIALGATEALDNFLVAAVDHPSSSDLTWIAMDNIIGALPNATIARVALLPPGTPLADLTLQYQLVGQAKVSGEILPVPEPSTWALLIAGAMLLVGTIRVTRIPRLAPPGVHH